MNTSCVVVTQSFAHFIPKCCHRDPNSPPLVTALSLSASQNAACFHFPGHNRGRAAPTSLSRLIGSEPFSHDLPELPELDLPLAQAQEQAARVFGASRTWFLVGGSTAGVHAAVMATCSPGDTLILPRNSHSSAFSAMVFSGAKPSYIVPHFDPRWDIAAGVTPSQVDTATSAAKLEGRRIGAVLVTSPTYHGICSDVRGISDLCRSRGIPLIVDEAHGAHFGFHSRFPSSALSGGADMAVQSTHKVLSSLTQSSMLHLASKTSLVDPARVSACLHALQTTSPSFLLLASLDAATHQLARDPEELFDPTVRIASEATDRIRGISDRISVLDGLTFLGFPTMDPLRLTLGFSGLGVSSERADEIMSNPEHNIVCELVGTRSITFAFNLGTCQDHVERLVSGLHHIVESSSPSSFSIEQHGACMPFDDFETRLIPREAFFAAKRRVEIESSMGEVSGEVVCPYPPGIPVLVPGETITETAIEYLLDVRNKGATITGPSDPNLSSILVCN